MNSPYTAHASSLGRIRHSVVADLRTFARPLMAMSGLIFILTVLVPRIPVLFTLNYSVWAYAYVDDYTPSIIFSVASSVVGIYVLWYVNKRVFSAEPMPLSLTPTSLGEKALAMLFVGLILNMIGWLTSVVCITVDWLTLPMTTFPSLQPLEGVVSWSRLEHTLSYEGGRLLLAVGIAYALLSLISLIYSAMRIRNFALSLLGGVLIPMSITLVLSVLFINVFEVDEYSGPGVPRPIYLLCSMVFMAALAMGYIAYRRFKTITT